MASLQQLIDAHTPQPLKSQWFAHYCNVYRDQAGETHYSTEEFSVEQDGIYSFDDALHDAFLRCVLAKEPWEYVSTMTDSASCTQRMASHLGALKNAASILKQAGENPEHYSIHDIEQVARDILAGKGRA